MTILVTGGAGFIGTNLVSRLSDNHHVKVVDDLSRGSMRNVPDDVEFVEANCLDTENLARLMQGVQSVVHLAAYGSVVESVEDPITNFDMNVRGTVSVLEAARTAGVKKLVFASTGGAIMGNTPPPVNEESLPKPISPYGAGKLCGEAYCHAYAMAYGIKTVCLRFANVYGPHSEHKKGVITRYIKCVLESNPFVIYGDGHSTRDYLHVDDLCNGITLGLEADVDPGQVFHLASGVETSLLDLVDHMRAISGDPEFPCEFKDLRAGEVDKNCANYDKAEAELGFRPTIALRDGLAETFNWFAERRDLVLSVEASDS